MGNRGVGYRFGPFYFNEGRFHGGDWVHILLSLEPVNMALLNGCKLRPNTNRPLTVVVSDGNTVCSNGVS